MTRYFIVIICSFLLLACTDDTFTTQIAQKELRAALPEKLEQADIWYRDEGEGKFSFKLHDRQKRNFRFFANP